MSFAPVIPLGGVPGWSLLTRIESDQRAAFSSRPDVAREAAYFRENIASATTAQALVSDRRLLDVALTAFGLEAEVGKRALVRAALESDPFDDRSFARRMVEPRWQKLAEAFGYGSPLGPEIIRPGFAQKITEAYQSRRFEIAVGESDSALRLALNARRELAAYAESDKADTAGWFSLLGDKPTRAVIEGAYGLPDGFAKLDVDRQRDDLRARTRELFGEPSLKVFKDPEAVETVIRRFLAREAATAGPDASTPGAVAVQLLANAAGPGLGAGGIQGLVLSGLR